MNISTIQLSSLGISRNSKVFSVGSAVLAGGLVLLLTVGCSTKNYVRSQTAPIIQQTNELDTKTAADHRNIQDTDTRAQSGIAGAKTAAATADQHAVAAGESADTATKSAQEAYNRVDSLSGVVANLDNYKPLADVNVTFAFDKAVLTKDDKKQLDDLAASLQNARGYILEVTGGTDSTGDANYNYQLSQRRADAVVNYLATTYNIPPHKFYLVGIGKDQQIADDHTLPVVPRTVAWRSSCCRIKLREPEPRLPTPGLADSNRTVMTGVVVLASLRTRRYVRVL